MNQKTCDQGTSIGNILSIAARRTPVPHARHYQTFCDPRLDYDQGLEMAVLIASTLAGKREGIAP